MGKKNKLKLIFTKKNTFQFSKRRFCFYQNIFGEKNFETSVNQVFIDGKKYYRNYR